MDLDRRRLLALSAVAAATTPVAAGTALAAAPLTSALGLDATHLGVHPGLPDDQTRAMQRAIDQAAGSRTPLALRPGVYRVGDIKLRTGTQLLGVRGATRLVLTQGRSLLESNSADRITLSGLILDGAGKALPEGRGLVHLAAGRDARIVDCEVTASGRHGIVLESVEGEVRGNTIVAAGNGGLFSLNARGLMITGNTLRGCGNNGIQIWRTEAGADGTLVVGNRIVQTAAKSGGEGQYGNAISIFRAGNVVVSGNRISGTAFSAVRGNAASNLQVMGNNCTGCGEVALYAEFGFEGAVIANNTVDGAAYGVSVTNFLDHGGRLGVVQGNIIRNLMPLRPVGTKPREGAGIGISVEGDSAVIGNVIENAPNIGIEAGWGKSLRDVTVTGNVIRRAGVGITVSVTPGAGAAVIADNLIAEAKSGIVGMDWKRVATGDLMNGGAERYAQLTVSGNRVR